MPISPEDAQLRSSIAGNTRWARSTNRTRDTQAMRDGFRAKLLREARERLGPGATEQAVALAADNALKAHLAKMRLNSLKSRRAAAAARKQAEADAMIDAIAQADQGAA